MITIDQINALRKRIEDLRGYLSIDEKAIEIAEEEKRTQDPEFWTNSKEAELVMKRIRTLKTWNNSTGPPAMLELIRDPVFYGNVRARQRFRNLACSILGFCWWHKALRDPSTS